MKKAPLLLLILGFVVSTASAQKLVKNVSKEACKCINSKDNELRKVVEPEVLLEDCLMRAFAKYEKGVKSLEKESKAEFNAFAAEVAKYVKSCGGFDHIKKKDGKYDITTITPHDDSTDCAGMREGVFLYPTPTNDYFIERRDSLQFEYWGVGDNKIETRIFWDSGCTYHTSHVGTNNPDVKKYISPGQGIKAVIITVKGNKYTLFVERPTGEQTILSYEKVKGKTFKYIGKE